MFFRFVFKVLLVGVGLLFYCFLSSSCKICITVSTFFMKGLHYCLSSYGRVHMIVFKFFGTGFCYCSYVFQVGFVLLF